jgi:CO dehydrogenase nickel-insertion accessory protein CooC1
MRSVDTLVLVSDTSLKGMRVAASIAEAAEGAVAFEELVFIINRVRSEGDLPVLVARSDLPVFTWVPEDETVRVFDDAGRSFLDVPECDALEAVRRSVAGLVCAP